MKFEPYESDCIHCNLSYLLNETLSELSFAISLHLLSSPLSW